MLCFAVLCCAVLMLANIAYMTASNARMLVLACRLAKLCLSRHCMQLQLSAPASTLLLTLHHVQAQTYMLFWVLHVHGQMAMSLARL